MSNSKSSRLNHLCHKRGVAQSTRMEHRRPEQTVARLHGRPSTLAPPDIRWSQTQDDSATLQKLTGPVSTPGDSPRNHALNYSTLPATCLLHCLVFVSPTLKDPSISIGDTCSLPHWGTPTSDTQLPSSPSGPERTLWELETMQEEHSLRLQRSVGTLVITVQFGMMGVFHGIGVEVEQGSRYQILSVSEALLVYFAG